MPFEPVGGQEFSVVIGGFIDESLRDEWTASPTRLFAIRSPAASVCRLAATPAAGPDRPNGWVKAAVPAVAQVTGSCSRFRGRAKATVG